MDKSLAKRAQDILFVKIENEGFDLGAQRKAIDKNNLPEALEILSKYKRNLLEGKVCEFSEEDKKMRTEWQSGGSRRGGLLSVGGEI